MVKQSVQSKKMLNTLFKVKEMVKYSPQSKRSKMVKRSGQGKQMKKYCQK